MLQKSKRFSNSIDSKTKTSQKLKHFKDQKAAKIEKLQNQNSSKTKMLQGTSHFAWVGEGGKTSIDSAATSTQCINDKLWRFEKAQ